MASTHYCARCLTTFKDDPEHCPNLSCGRARPESEGWGRLLGPGDQLDRHYEIGRPLAVGGAGITYLAREIDASGEAVPPELAIKVLYSVRASGPYLRRLANEAQILQELDHDNIVKCRGFVQRVGHEPYLVTLFEHGGSLAHHVDRVGPLPPRIAAGILRQILLALDVAHQRGVVHRDLKPDNVLLHVRVEATEMPLVRVADFGIAKIAGGLSSHLTRVGTFLGTPEFAAPEQFRAEPPTPATDVFAAGALLVYLLTGRAPFTFSQRGDLETSYREMLAQLPPRLELPGAAPDEVAILQDVLDNMVALEPTARWTVHQVIARLGWVLGEVPRPVHETLDFTARGAPTRETQPRAIRAQTTLHADSEHSATGLLVPPEPVQRVDVSTLDDTPVASPRPAAPPPAVDPPAASPAPPPVPAVDPPAREPVQPPIQRAPSLPEQPMASKPPPFGGPSYTAPEPDAPQGGSGCVGLLAGLGAAGMLVTVVGGGLATAAVLALTAWGTGWFGGDASHPVVQLDPVVIDVAEQARMRNARPLLGGDDAARAARMEIIAALDDLGGELGRRCATSGRALGTLLVDDAGTVIDATVDALPKGACVADALRGKKVPNRSRAAAVARVAFVVGDR